MSIKNILDTIESKKKENETKEVELQAKIEKLKQELIDINVNSIYEELALTNDDKRVKYLNDMLDRAETIKKTLKRLEIAKETIPPVKIDAELVLDELKGMNINKAIEIKKEIFSDLEKAAEKFELLNKEILTVKSNTYQMHKIQKDYTDGSELVDKELRRLLGEISTLSFNVIDLKKFDNLKSKYEIIQRATTITNLD